MEKGRVSTGVSGLDKILGGGYIKGRSMLVAGGPGTGKSILSWHFLFDGIQNGESGILLSLDQTSEMIKDDMLAFGWNSEEAIENQSLTILSGVTKLVPRETGFDYMIDFDHPLLREQPFTVPRLSELVKKNASDNKATRIVVDGLGPLLEIAGNRFDIRQMVYNFIRELTIKDVTILLTHELRSSTGAQNDEMPFFLCDGVIILNMIYTSGDYVRTMRVVKMRGSNHVMRPMMFKITGTGISAFPDTRLPE